MCDGAVLTVAVGWNRSIDRDTKIQQTDRSSIHPPIHLPIFRFVVHRGAHTVQGIYDDILEVVNDEAKTMREVREWLDAWTEDRISVIDQQTVKQTSAPTHPIDATTQTRKKKQTQYKAVLRMRRDTGMDRLLRDPYEVRALSALSCLDIDVDGGTKRAMRYWH